MCACVSAVACVLCVDKKCAKNHATSQFMYGQRPQTETNGQKLELFP